MTAEHTKPWSPLSPAEVMDLIAPAQFPWWIAGGYALELAVGRSWRLHADIDILILRRDASLLHDCLRGWDLWVADPPGQLRPWQAGETLVIPVHDVWCRKSPTAAWCCQFMIDECDGDKWVSRRSEAINMPVEEMGRISAGGIPYMAPQIQLYYKAKAPRPKDEYDFAQTLPHLDNRSRAWLRDAISTTYDIDHPWLVALKENEETA